MVVIHIGTQKTGTTVLQSYLHRNTTGLLKQGIRYIYAGRYKNGLRASHNVLARAVQGRAESTVWDELRRELAESKSRINLLSAEGFWFCDPAALKQQLTEVKDVRIVVYLRRQDQYLQSLYMQAVRGGRRLSFADWRENVPDRGKYLQAIDKWADAFGSEAIIIRPHERNGVTDTVGDFCRVLGSKPLVPDETIRSNSSPRRELLHFLRALNQLGLDVNERELFHEVAARDPAYVSSCHLLTYEESLALMESHAEENRILIEKYYRDESVPLFPELLPFEPLRKWDTESEEFFKLTVDVLKVVIAFATTGRMSLPGPKPAQETGRESSPPGGSVNSSGDARECRRTERQRPRATPHPAPCRGIHLTAAPEGQAVAPAVITSPAPPPARG